MQLKFASFCPDLKLLFALYFAPFAGGEFITFSTRFGNFVSLSFDSFFPSIVFVFALYLRDTECIIFESLAGPSEMTPGALRLNIKFITGTHFWLVDFYHL